MKKLVLSLLGAAALATSSNAMALNTIQPFTVTLNVGRLVPIFAGVAMFDFDSMSFNLPTAVGVQPPTGVSFPGSCVYQMEWINATPASSFGPGLLPLSAQCFVAEQMVHGAVSCVPNALHNFPSLLNAMTDPSDLNDPCDGFDPFGQISKILVLQIGESAPELEGIVQFDSIATAHTIYGIVFHL
jgi:hypothetical protein